MEYKIMNELPLEINNMIYSYLGKSIIAVMVEEHFNPIEPEMEVCNECGVDVEPNSLHGDGISGLCEYCYAISIGVDVFACQECGVQTYTWTNFVNTEHGLYCHSCYEPPEDEDN
jgi:hypothetical protein